MAHEKLAEKLGAYYARLGAGKAHKIKARDVAKVLEKLRERRAALAEETPEKLEKAARLQGRIAAADELIGRAEWLLAELGRITPADTAPADEADEAEASTADNAATPNADAASEAPRQD
jgi:hypothetical protein